MDCVQLRDDELLRHFRLQVADECSTRDPDAHNVVSSRSCRATARRFSDSDADRYSICYSYRNTDGKSHCFPHSASDREADCHSDGISDTDLHSAECTAELVSYGRTDAATVF